MNVTVTPAPKSTLTVRVEVPSEKLDAAILEAVRHLSQRTKIAGFRPGKAPRVVVERIVGPEAVLEEAVDHVVQRAYRDALVQNDILPLTQGDVNVEQGEEGKPVIFTATVQVRPEVKIGDYRNFNFKPEIDVIDDAKVDTVIEELRDQNATLAPVEDRGAQNGDYAVIGYKGTRDGVPFDGGSAERMPLILGEERLIPGFEAHVVGLKSGESTGFDIDFPEDYPEATLAGKQAHFEVEVKELRQKIQPVADDEFAKSLGSFEDLKALRAEIQHRLERNALDRARHTFAGNLCADAIAASSVASSRSRSMPVATACPNRSFGAVPSSKRVRASCPTTVRDPISRTGWNAGRNARPLTTAATSARSSVRRRRSAHAGARTAAATAAYSARRGSCSSSTSTPSGAVLAVRRCPNAVASEVNGCTATALSPSSSQTQAPGSWCNRWLAIVWRIGPAAAFRRAGPHASSSLLATVPRVPRAAISYTPEPFV